MSKIVDGVKEAAAIARGEAPAARIWHNGIAYVPETEGKALAAHRDDVSVNLAVSGLLKSRLDDRLHPALKARLSEIYRAATGKEL